MSPVRRLAAGMSVAAIAILATALPASAHDELIHSDPAAESQLEVSPETVTMQFSGTLLTLGESMSGAVVLVVDEAGHDWVSGPAEVVGDTVTVPLTPDLPTAGYQVRWQVVSEDGHPISGVIPFTIGDAAPMTGSSDAPSSSPTEAAAASSTEQAADETGGALRLLLVGGGGALLAAAVFAAFRFLRRRRTAPASTGTAPHADEEHREVHE